MSQYQSPDVLSPMLTELWDKDRSWTLAVAQAHGAYTGLAKAREMEAAEIVNAIKDSGLRGRGGAGFPAGMKWSFLPPDDGKPRYLVVNADESEPGTCKDIPFMMADPHMLLEGIAIASRAINCKHAFIYLRGEVVHVYRRLLGAIREATEAGVFSDLKITAHAGAGAYICGEETALLDSLEGMRGHPRLKPPFPAVAGLYARPTVVNNVETIANVALAFRHSIDWYKTLGTEKAHGTAIYSLSGHLKNPGQFEAPMGITMRELIEFAGGMRDGRKLKFWTPGGSSTPIFTEAELDIPLDYDSVVAAGSMLGTRALQVFDETTSVVRAVLKWTEFYQHESCGKCTPCREGTYWLKQIMLRIEAGRGRPGDLELLEDVCSNIGGRSFCALGDAAITPIKSALKLFREEFEAGIEKEDGTPGIPAAELFPYAASTAYAKGGVR